MDVGMMRFMDYWLGKPLCFLFSSIDYILRKLSFYKKNTQIPKKILIIKLSELGAIILSYPFLKQLKERYPAAELFFVTFKKNRPVFKLLNGIIPSENISLINDRSICLFIADTLKLIASLQIKKFDIVFDLEFFSRFSSILTYLSGAAKKAGFFRYTFEGLYRGSFLTHNIQYNPTNHIVKNYLSLGKEIDKKNKKSPEIDEQISVDNLDFPKYITQREIKKELQSKLKNINPDNVIFLFNPGEGVLPLREWPIDNFIILSRMILQEKNNRIIIVGTEGADNKAGLMQDTLNNARCLNLVNQTSLEELMELFLISAALISNDCGLAHLSMLTSIKKFIIFGPESPQVFGPLGSNNYILYSDWPCSPCLSVLNHRGSACRDNKCLKNINPESVHKLIKTNI